MGTVNFISVNNEAVTVDGIVGASIMQLATANGVAGIVAECGGSMSCATCHIYIDEDWVAITGESGEGEKAMLEFAEEPRLTSRLSCQVTYSEALDGLTVRIPESQ